MSNELSIIMSFVCLLLVGHSWYVHYKVKDGLARVMLLWGCGLIFTFLLLRIVNLSLLVWEVIDLAESKELANYGILLIYAIVIGQYLIQKGRKERN